MATTVKSIRSSVKWGGILAACVTTLLPIAKRCVEPFPNWAAGQSNLCYGDRQFLYELFFRVSLEEERKNTRVYPNSPYGGNKIGDEICSDPNYKVSESFKALARDKDFLNSHLAFVLVSHKTWKGWWKDPNAIDPYDVQLARDNPHSLFSRALTPKEEYPIGPPDLKILQEQPDCPFSRGLRNHPGLQEAIKKFRLDKDPYFAVYLED